MRIVICTTPIRRHATEYPPFGSLAIIQSLRSVGHNPYFYDIDGLRPTFDEVLEFLRGEQPDVVAISAVVSTAYAYTKQLCLALRKIAPHTKIILGGNLAASAEILHRKATVDFCVVGEGERVIVNLIQYLESHPDTRDDPALERIKGITYLRRDGHMNFTGYEIAIPAAEFLDPDFSILEEYSRIENFIGDPLSRFDFAQDPRAHEAHRVGKKMSTVVSTKGCVARCTFCHRWDKGFRADPVDDIIRRIRYLMEHYNVGFIQFGDENFGSDRRQLDELIGAIKPLDVLYKVGGVRCRSVDPDLLRRMKESGCVALYYGMESGSPDILQVMEKNTSLEENLNAARWTHEAGLYTVCQLVLGMPGETETTISETIEFLKSATESLPESPTRRLSINYTQALPGTPVYEYARANGLIGRSLEDEEEYLWTISDSDAAVDTMNYTSSDHLTVQSWRQKIVAETVGHYYRHNKLPTAGALECLRKVVLPEMLHRLWPSRFAPPTAGQVGVGMDYEQGGYFNLTVKNVDVVYSSLYRFRTVVIWGVVLVNDLIRLPFREFLVCLWQCALAKLRGPRQGPEKIAQSLRKVMQETRAQPSTVSEESMQALRNGR